MSKVIYCISGLGTDEKIFANLILEGFTLKFIPWLRPEVNEKIEAYASRMALYIKEPNPLVLGVSFGGMMAIEIARQVRMKKLFIVSAVKSSAELPTWMKLVAKLRLNKMLPVRSFNFTERFDNAKLGISNETERLMAKMYREQSDPVYMKWAVNEALNWKNKWQPDNIIHIHGDQDRIFPIKTIKADYVIKGGTHMMIYNRSNDIAASIKKELGGS